MPELAGRATGPNAEINSIAGDDGAAAGQFPGLEADQRGQAGHASVRALV